MSGGNPVTGAESIRGPSTLAELPRYDDGWLLADGERLPYFSTVENRSPVNWSADLEHLHEESSRTHFLDRWTRGAVVAGIGPQRPDVTIADLGCSTGHLLEDLQRAHPGATLIGVDLVPAGLLKAHVLLPGARLLHADVCRLPLVDASIDAIVSANLLEHVPDDALALREAARIIRPGGMLALVVPAGPRTYDYYDRFLGHERRYARGELAGKCRAAGLEVMHDGFIAALLYPAFWLVKQRNRRLRGDLEGEALRARVAGDISRTQDSRVGELIWRVEERLGRAGLRLPFGIRSLVVARRPEAGQ
jgi:SAM-dependent methyltransferase